MASIRGSRLPVGSASWISEERSAALQIAEDEAEEFSYSARNELEWLNEHMTGIFDENEINVAEMFKTPGKLRGKTPRAVRKQETTEARVPLSDIFAGTPRGVPNPFLQQLNRINSPSTAAASNELKKPSTTPAYSPPKRPLPSPTRQLPNIPHADSGYHGSQSQDIEGPFSPAQTRALPQVRSPIDAVSPVASPTLYRQQSPTRTRVLQSPTATFLTAKEEQTARNIADTMPQPSSPQITRSQKLQSPFEAPSSPLVVRSPSPKKTSPIRSSPVKISSPVKVSPAKVSVASPIIRKPVPAPAEPEPEPVEGDESNDDEGSHTDNSSPVRPAIRKSSLNFATLPAREPLTTGKSLGGRMSRTSHLDLHRASYYDRPMGGKSLGGNTVVYPSDGDDDEMDVDEDEKTVAQQHVEPPADHNKTYTQRLQDRIGMLGQSQAKPSRPSKSIANLAPISTAATPVSPQRPEQKMSSPLRKPTTPGAFPDEEEEDDDWIDPPVTVAKQSSPPPAVPPKDAAPITATTKGSSDGGHADFVLPKQRQANSRPNSPYKAPIIPDRTTSTLPHMKSASVSALPNTLTQDDASSLSPKKPISVSNPTLASVSESSRPPSPMKSPSRTLRDSPLKQVKNKLSSILKSSKGLLASSAAISAEGKSSMLSPSTTRLGYFTGASSESIAQPNSGESMYPDLSKALADAQSAPSLTSPTKANGRRTRASAERERKEKMVEKETRRLADQMGKLEKEREKEREKARVFSKEQERIAAMEKQMATQKEVEKKRPAEKEIAKPTRSSPRRAKPQDQDVEMQDAAAAMPPPPQPASLPRPAGPGPAIRNRELKRPARPAKDAVTKSKAAPMVIKVNMGPHHSQYHPSNNALSANLHESLVAAVPQPQLSSKPSQSKLKSKSSVQSLKSSVSSSGRPKALELAAKRKEQEEREAQRKREARAELERKRAAQQEEDRRIEAEKKMAKEKEAEAKKAAQRQAAIEKAKQTRAPPPAVRAQPNGPPEYAAPLEQQQQQQQQQPQAVSRPPSRLGSSVFRSQEDLNRPVNTLLSNANKSQKRPLGQDNDGGNARAAPARSGPTYQGQDAKRRRTSQEFEDDKDVKAVSNIKGPPVRPSAGYKKVEAPTKPVFNNGYSAAPTGASRDLFKTTVTSQHNSAMKAAHPLDMAQFSKGAIPFAPNPSQAGTAYKTPARQGQVANVKSTAKSGPRTSPRFPNGDSIELPEIDTDDEDEDSDADQGMVASWADSPDLRRALLRQETMDPSHIFGPPAPLNMEEVFNKSKDRWHKFRARTSSANWSGADRLTEDDIRKDLAARDRLRREGAWTYELSKDMA